MRVVVQRVTSASVMVDDRVISQIRQGLLVLLGMQNGDQSSQLPWLVDKLASLRIFCDKVGKMNLSMQDIDGSFLVVSQFTLYADCRTGRRPSFLNSLVSEKAEVLYEEFISLLKKKVGKDKVQTGRFGANMEVQLVNDGPVTLIIDA